MKIGFIDKYLDEWHANHLPGWLREETNVEAIYCWEEIPSPLEGAIDGKTWAKEHDAIYCDTIEEVVKNSDVIIVLGPSFPESHEKFCEIPFKYGKPTYVDKTFAPDRETARRIIDKALASGAPMYSTSALRHSTELKDVPRDNIESISMRGPGPLEMYSIHQIEPIVSLMGTDAEAVMFMGTYEHPGYAIRFKGGRYATAQHFDWECPFNLSINYSDDKPSCYVKECTDFFPNFVKELVKFFETKEKPVDYAQTEAVIAIRAAVLKAKDTPYEWVKI